MVTKRGVTVFIICAVLISTVTVYPLMGEPSSSFFARHTRTDNSSPSICSHEDNISLLYDCMIDKICNNINPLDELRILFSYDGIKENIRRLSDDRTVTLLEILFSEGKPLLKIVGIKQFQNMMEKKQEQVNLHQVTDEIHRVVQGDISIEQLSFLPPITLSSNDIYNYSSEWRTYIEHTPWLKSIIDESNLDPISFLIVFVVLLVLWSFGCGAASIALPVLYELTVLVVTSGVLGFAGSFTVGTFFSTDLPIVERLLELFYPLTSEQLVSVVGPAVCLVVLGVYWSLELVNNSLINLLLEAGSGGLFLLWPPFVASILLLLSLDQV